MTRNSTSRCLGVRNQFRTNIGSSGRLSPARPAAVCVICVRDCRTWRDASVRDGFVTTEAGAANRISAVPASRLSARQRQLLQRSLFLAAIIAPSVVLVTLGLRLIAQDRELAEKRAQDGRQLALAATAQRLTTRLDQLKLQALAGGAAVNPGSHPIALVASVEGDRLILPWDGASASAAFRREIAAEPFAAAFSQAEADEFRLRNPVTAYRTYGTALAVARSPEQRAAALLGRLRTAPSRAEVHEATSFLLRSQVADEEGVPVSLYALRVFLRDATATPASQQIAGTLRATLDRTPSLDLVGLGMVADLIEAPAFDAAELRETVSALRGDVRRRLAAAKQAQDLQTAFRGFAVRTEGTDSVWVPFGPEADIWLVTVTRPPIAPAARAIAVRGRLAVDLTDITFGRRLDGYEPLGPGYPGLFVKVPSGPAADSASVRPVLIGVVFLTLAVAFTGSWFFWRDVQRDLRVAELRSQFVASVSHELKTPLTAIRMFAETLRLGRTPAHRTTEYLDTIVSESERLTRLLNNVLDFSKVEQGTRTYRLTPQPLAPIVQSAARTMQYALEQDGFDLRLAIEDAPLIARCDADAMEQAILNLLSNAMKYSGASRIIGLSLIARDGGAAIAVNDRGIGIPAAEQSRVFEKFYRGSGDSHQRVAGTGLGLTLVQHTVGAHGGSVAVASRSGEGSTFTILLPTIPPGEVAATSPASVLPAHAASTVIES